LLNIAPSAINRQITQAEEELGVLLFDRLPQGLRLTAAGEHLIYNLRRWNREFGKVKSEIDSIQGLAGGTISIAIAEAVAGDLLASTIADFHVDYPHVMVSIRVAAGGGVREMVLSGSADIGLTFRSTAYRVMRVEHSVLLTPGLAMLPDHILADRTSISLQECCELPLILPEEGFFIRNSIDAAAASTGVVLNQVVECNNFALMKAMVFRHVGVALLTRAEILSEIRSGKLSFVPLSDPAVEPSTLSLITSLHPSSAAVQLAGTLAKAMDDMTETSRSKF
jgi:DNA-binding transcriptional LysR family regulator